MFHLRRSQFLQVFNNRCEHMRDSPCYPRNISTHAFLSSAYHLECNIQHICTTARCLSNHEQPRRDVVLPLQAQPRGHRELAHHGPALPDRLLLYGPPSNGSAGFGQVRSLTQPVSLPSVTPPNHTCGALQPIRMPLVLPMVYTHESEACINFTFFFISIFSFHNVSLVIDPCVPCVPA